MQTDPGSSRRPGPAAAMLCGFLFVGSALLVLCSSYHGPDVNQQHIPRARRAVPQTAEPGTPPEKPVAFLSEAKEDPSVMSWDRRTLRGGFHYEGGRLEVPRTGRYMVYFQLNYFGEGEVVCKNGKPLMLTQKVIWVRKSYTTNKPLLQVQDTVPCHLGLFSKTLQASAAFDLTEGDQLYVHTNHPELLNTKGYLGVDLEL